MKLKEVIVVEGKNDSNVLKSHFDCDTIITHGTHLGKKTLELIKATNEKRGIIVFTDPDAPGEKIRCAINSYVPNCKNAFIDRKKAVGRRKIGVEHASKEDLEESLKHLMTYTENLTPTISMSDFIELGLNGQDDSQLKRNKLGEILFLGAPNAKTLLKRLNMLQLNKEDIRKILETKEEEDE